ncbi:MAG TPA: XdhC family protein [Polyangiaceae bacterium]|jgi:xanthine dehydrogenase accessory factor|nr:XdhC family protein [Polyangiaceae bacterium]
MVEVKFLVEAAEKLRAAREPFLVATVMRVRGSSYRRPGARMLMTRDRWIEGSVSGGCLEKDVLQKAWWRTEAGPALITYDLRADEELRAGFGLGCDGVVDVLLERAEAGDGARPAPEPAPERRERIDALRVLARCTERQTRGALATVFESAHPAVPIGARVSVVNRRPRAARAAAGAMDSVDANDAADPMDPVVRASLADACATVLANGTRTEAVVADGAVTALVEPIRPAPRLFLFGAGHDAVPVARFAQMVAWEAWVCEPRARLATRGRFAFADAILDGEPEAIAARLDASDRAVAVVMGHDYERDRAWLHALLSSRAIYIGMLGPRRRTERMRAELGVALDARVFAPMGLALGAETPHEIALATIAEIEAVLADAPATSLRDRSFDRVTAAAAE